MHLRPASILATLLLAGAMMATQAAHAYFPGKTAADNAELKQQPKPDAPTVKTIPKGTSFNATDTPNNGYYYIRTATDLGWIDGAAIGKAPTPSPTQTPKARRTQKKQANKAKERKQSKGRTFYMAKVHLDYDIFTVGELNAATNSTSFANGLGAGGEFLYFFNPLTAAGIRIDSISQSVSASDASNNNSTIDFKLSTLAIMAGAERILWEDESNYVAAAGYLGLAFSKLTMNATGSPAPNTTEYSGKPLTVMGLVEGGWKISSMFSLYAEAGYRLLNSSNVSPSPKGNAPGTLSGLAVSLNFSGPVLGLGLSARF